MRRHFSVEDKIRIVLEGLRGEDSIAELCRHEGIVQNLYYRWSKDFLEAGKKRLAGDTARAATSDEVRDLRREAGALKEVVAELTLENRLLKKKRDGGWGGRRMRYADRRGGYATCPNVRSGPNPDRLFLGSEGALGIITEAWVRLHRRPTFRLSTTVRFSDYEKAVAAVQSPASLRAYRCTRA